MAPTNRNTFMRSDTLFGICEAIGQDFNINPLWIRLAIVPAIFFAPVLTLGVYLAAGVAVLASRLMFPVKAVAEAVATPAAATPAAAAVPQTARQDEDTPFALAA